MTILTNRLRLRPFNMDDFCWYKGVVTDEEFKMRLPGIACEQDDVIKETIELFSKADFINDFYYVICDFSNNVFGVIVAVRITGLIIDVSYFLKANFRHNGYMREAVASLVSYARRIEPSYRFRFVIEQNNKESLNVVKSLDASVLQVNEKYVCYL